MLRIGKLFIALLLVATPTSAAEHYIRAAATGTGAGTSWINAYTGFGTTAGKINPASMVRGDTYWIAVGAYGAVTFSSPVSGSTVITVEAATTANHGSAVDWSDTFAGQATFIGVNQVSTSFWTFEGQSRGSDWQSGYNIKFWNQSNATGWAVGIAGTHITFDYVELEGTGMTGGNFPSNTTANKCSTDGCGTWNDNAINNQPSTGNNTTSNLYVGHSWAHHTGNTQFQLNTFSHSTATFEYNWVSYNHTGQNGIHDEAFSIYYSNLTVRFNVFQDICGTGIITDAGGATPAIPNWDVYGNLFFWDAAYAGFNGNFSLGTIDNAIVSFLGENMSGGFIHFYNNTMAGFYNTVADSSGSAFSTLAISGLSGQSTGNPTVTMYDNLWYRSAYTTGDFSDYCSVVTMASCTQDYDAFFQGGIPSGDFMNPSETHAQIVTAATNPFLNFAASTIAGLQLTSHTTAGLTLASPYNVDMLGVTRGINSVWDRGGLQLGGPPAPPFMHPPIVLGDILFGVN